MKVLLIGSGGREHTFAHLITKSPQCEALFIAPGNAGTALCGTNVDIAVTDFESMKALVIEEGIEMLVVGPEAPLVEGIRDFFEADPALAKVAVIGPDKEGAQLEGSKAFSKAFMNRHNIPCAQSLNVTEANLDAGLSHIDNGKGPYVLKADGLAAGKGVLIIEDKAEAKKELKAMLSGKFGAASSKVLIEDFLDGIEFSIFALFDGKNYIVLPAAKDYKRIGEGDVGLNTGGMGAVSPVPFLDNTLMRKVEDRIIKPTFDGLISEGIDYRGFVFFGLIKVGDEPMTIEYNARMGDPETEAVLPRIKNDWLDLFMKVPEQKLNEVELELDQRTALTLVMASGGYPEKYEKGKEIEVGELHDRCLLFHAGTKVDGSLKTNGGRVMALTTFGNDISDCQALAFSEVEKIAFEGKYYRKDIGNDLKEFLREG